MDTHEYIRETHLVDDGTFDALDPHRLFVYSQHACTLAGRGAYTTRELGEIVRHEKAVQGILPLVLEHKVIPLGNDIGNRAAGIGLAERNAAVHATRRLVLQLLFRKTRRNLLPILHSLARRTVGLRETLVLHKPARLVKLVQALLRCGIVDQ